ncbi:MAG: hypothetical protein L6416_04265 [Candidatus Omnitrophica bacterium]|nr:hypothetical protein [Candidatus Omnitrophota bacterium]
MNNGGILNRVKGLGGRGWIIIGLMAGMFLVQNHAAFAQEVTDNESVLELMDDVEEIDNQPTELELSGPLAIEDEIIEEDFAEAEEEKPKDIFDLVIPASWGRVKEVYKGSSEEVIIHIQDAHNNYEAQTNIANIIDSLVEEYGLNIAGIEGSVGRIMTELYSTFPDDDARYLASDFFVRDGTFSGPEALVIRKGFEYPLKIYGIENEELYNTNLEAFKESLPFKKDAIAYFKELGSRLGELKSQLYTPELLEIDGKQLAYEIGFLSLNDYCQYLNNMVKDMEQINEDYPNFKKLLKAVEIEEVLDFAKAEEERTKLLTELTNVLTEEDIRKLLDKGIAYKNEQMSASLYLSFVKELAKKNEVDFTEYKNLDQYIEYATSYDEIESFELFNEIEEVNLAIRSKLYAIDTQKKLDFLVRGLKVMMRLVEIKMVNKDLEFYMSHQSELKVDEYISFIKEQAGEYGITMDLPVDISYLDVYIPAWVEFYRVAGFRDAAMIDNTLKLLRKNKQRLGIMVTGGFHTRKLIELMQERGISYIVVTPRITQNIPGPYFDRMTGKKTEWEEVLEGAREIVPQEAGNVQ